MTAVEVEETDSRKFERRVTSAFLAMAVTVLGVLSVRWMDQLEERTRKLETAQLELSPKISRLETQVLDIQQNQGQVREDMRRLSDKLDRVLEILQKR